MKFSDIVNRVIDLSAAVHAYWERELPKRHPNYPLVDPNVSDPPPPPEEDELVQLLASLSRDELSKLIALTEVWRWNHDHLQSQWETNVLKKRRDRQYDAKLLARSGLPANALREGLIRLNANNVDVDSATTTSLVP